ncbi:hypothetical protein [Chryseobacterium sp.]|uniref:hypothetical protein n=1 Tax=Chryseobacterium sp. TaxID=1871047 RepID=UPI0011CC2813|nr:hypothetical protein [Chryseobacterium sp.]TXF75895.1 hypothetical protein FUA25_08290 [Chryseobacterium sp.]
MINTRILEVIRNPENLRSEDINTFEQEIGKFPYIQNIRALHLFATRKFSPENYQAELSRTAAYTTDKKILYQFITKNFQEKNIPEESVIQKSEAKTSGIIEEQSEEQPKTVYEEIKAVPVIAPEPVFVKGALNRILFEGEEDFMERENEVIDIESTKESGQIVTQNPTAAKIPEAEKPFVEEVSQEIKSEPLQVQPDQSSEVVKPETFSTETVIHPGTISAVVGTVENAAELSFHGLDEFLPEIKISAGSNSETYKIPKPQTDKNDEEMKRLIAEVEAKVQRTKKEPAKKEEEPVQNTDVNFSDIQSFEITTPKAAVSESEGKDSLKVPEKPENSDENNLIKTEKPAETNINTVDSEKPVWKPMQFSNNIPDSLISKAQVSEDKPVEKPVISAPINTKSEPQIAPPAEAKSDERPVFNVSFFTQNVSAIDSKKEDNEDKKEAKAVSEPAALPDSNVPTFINTWQNWLKIDRNSSKNEEKGEVSREEIKTKVIENFIEKEPRISQLKEESTFVVKEKGDDISHLMTETLAKIYTDQKLFSKAIKAYGILSEKHPEKKVIFDTRIQEIKELRKNQ